MGDKPDCFDENATGVKHRPRNDSIDANSLLLHADTAETAIERDEDFVRDLSSTEGWESTYNRARLAEHKAEFEAALVGLLEETELEYGVQSPADDLLRGCLSESDAFTREWLNSIFLKNWHLVPIISGILRLLSHLDYEDVFPEGPTIALAALTHSSAEVRESGIRAFENWSVPDSLRVLENLHCPELWLRAYVDQVIVDIRNQLADVSDC